MSALAQVGFIGLGNMGGAIAERLARSGAVALHVFDRDPAASERLAALGATAQASARAVADTAAQVFTCLPSVDASRAALFGPDGIAGGKAVRHCVEMSTIGPGAMRELATRLEAAGLGALDAPVSGGAAGALKGTLAIMVSGAPAVREAAAPVLAAISPKVFTISDRAGDAQVMKLVNNLLAAANMATSFEALVLGVKLGLQPETIIEVVNAGSGRNTGMDDRKTGAILSRRFEGLGKIALLEKDIALAFEVAREAGFPLEATPTIGGMAQLWERAVQQGMAGEDVSALVKVVERRAGVEVHGRAG
ncbi:NAD(P)-dependent oxidoreductase [Xenophilus azovorans]|uniref:NAD(P)-dependent oxidoreductase n=1 Tax=Xenophilus azovorans TaxID=151755 RepID=UPI00057026C3|nr:NAD(P)-dependent oxidoreductase [Xenophilus azovorans]